VSDQDVIAKNRYFSIFSENKVFLTASSIHNIYI